jgi:hypothetical protein
LDRTDIQNNPLRDLVTPRNPRSPYTFINYLHCHDRLFDFLNLGVQFPLRKDFAKYVSWVASHFTSLVRFGGEVTSIQSASTESGKPTYRIRTATGALYHAPTLVVAPGRTPNIPGAFESLLGPRVFHLTEYRARMDALLSRPIPSLRSARQIASPILPGRALALSPTGQTQFRKVFGIDDAITDECQAAPQEPCAPDADHYDGPGQRSKARLQPPACIATLDLGLGA